MRISVRIKSKRFHIILAGYFTEITASDKNLVVHTSEISEKFSEMSVRVT